MSPKAISVDALENYMLRIEFDNGEQKIFDVKPYFKFKVFEEIKDLEMFNTVKIAGLSIKWDNGVDICPDELYNTSIKC